MSEYLATLLRPVLSNQALDLLLVPGFAVGVYALWPRERPAPPADGKKPRAEGLFDRIDVLLAGIVLGLLVGVRMHWTPSIAGFVASIDHAPLLRSGGWTLPVAAVTLYCVWLHILVPLFSSAKPKKAEAGANGHSNGTGNGHAVAGSAAAEQKSRKFDALDRVVQVWNLFLATLSLFMLMSLIEHMITFLFKVNFSLQQALVDTQKLRWTGVGAFALWVFDISKFLELFDTVLIVARKGRSGVILLHWYHHVTVLLYTWGAVIVQFSPGWFFATINCGVHTIMYWYYFRASCGVRLGYDKFVTTIQLLQMLAGIAVTGGWTYYYYTDYVATAPGMSATSPANVGESMIIASVVMYGSYFVLFAIFYVARYCSKKNERVAGDDKAAKKHA